MEVLLAMNNMNFYDNKEKYRKTRKRYSRKAFFVMAIGFAVVGTLIGTAITRYSLSKNPKEMSENKNIVPIAYAEEKDITSLPALVKKVSPAVVGVSTKSIVQNSRRNGVGIQEGIGSGFIINNDGYVLTNYHVIAGAQSVKVIYNDGKEVDASVVNYDSNQDIAVVKITDTASVPGIVELGDSDTLATGESVIAIGNPLGKEFIGSVTSGIISSLNREITIDNKNLNLLQTDAAINPGNSGGPLLNLKGQVIGINTAKIGAEGIEGIGFSIPINIVKDKIQTLSKPILMIGIAGVNVTDDLANRNNLPYGVYIKEIQPESPAEKAGIKIGDVITKFDGKTIKSIEELNAIKNSHNSGDIIAIELVRNNNSISVNLTL